MAKNITVDDIYRGTKANEIITVVGKERVAVYGEGGNDSITVKKGKSHYIYGGAGKDTITINEKSGNEIHISGDKGNDIINVKKGNNHVIFGDTRGDIYDDFSCEYGDNGPVSGNDTITLWTGKGHKVYGGKGADKIIVKKGVGFYEIYGNEGNDTITVDKGAKAGTENHKAEIDGGKGDDRIAVTKGKYYSIYGGMGNDNIQVTGGSYYKIIGGYYSADKNKEDVITVRNVKYFEIGNPSKGSVTITGCSDGSIDAGANTKVTVNNSSSVAIDGGKTIMINGGDKISIEGDTIINGRLWEIDEKLTIKSGSGSAKLGGGTGDVTIDFKKAKKIGDWEISASDLKNNRLTVLNAGIEEFNIERKTETWGLLNYVDSDCWVMKHNTTGATIKLTGWSDMADRTFEIYFKKDNTLAYGTPATDWWEAKPYGT